MSRRLCNVISSQAGRSRFQETLLNSKIYELAICPPIIIHFY